MNRLLLQKNILQSYSYDDKYHFVKVCDWYVTPIYSHATFIHKDEQSGYGLFLSGMTTKSMYQNLIDNKFTGVVTIFQDAVDYPEKIENLHIPLYDSSDQNLSEYFDDAIEFITKRIQNGNVLVHCYAGISRSSTIVLAYLIKKCKISLKDAYYMVKQRRWIIDPNPGFILQLQEFEKKVLS